LLQRTLGGSYQLEIIRHAGLCFTQADISSLEQAVVNLCVNARDAMEEGGAITVETGNVYLDDHYALEEGVPAGEYVMVAVSDTGTGIDAETLMRVFEPYFTTKPVGRGTGRGLSQVYGFVAQSYGHLKMYSEVGYATPSFTTAAWTEACSCYLSRSHCATSQSRCAKCLIHNLSSIGNNLSQTHGSNTYDPLLLFRHVPK
ncbi:ATP-binding protein, partial [Pseudomonas oryzihabitans]